VLKGGLWKVLLLVLFVAKILDIVHLLKPNTMNVLESGSSGLFRWNKERREPTPRFEASSFECAHQGRVFTFHIPHGYESRSNLQNIEVFFRLR